MRDWTIREAASADAAMLASVIRAAFEEHRGRLDPPSGAHGETADTIGQKLATGKAAIAETPAGMIGCVFFEEEPGRVYISRLSVLSAERGRGVARELMEFAEAWAHRRGLGRAYLGVRVVLKEQQAYYARRGYVVVGEATHAGYAAATYLVMEKELA